MLTKIKDVEQFAEANHYACHVLCIKEKQIPAPHYGG